MTEGGSEGVSELENEGVASDRVRERWSEGERD
jgi:hypothetical protein